MSEKRSLSVRFFVLLSIVAVFMLSVGLQAQETTAGLQGTVKDAGGAVVPKALVELNSSALVGSKTLQTDATGYYRFANLPPGTYAVTVKAGGFATLKREGITLEVGHLPTLDLVLKVGSAETVVEVTAEAPLIDLTTNTTLTNVTEDVIADVPHGRSFQSVIQFAPSARNEPLAGGSLNANAGVTSSVGGTGAGNSSPGNGGNGNSFGYSVAGGADSENSYLVEGQETANLIGGYSHTNVPFEFIQEVQVKSSGVEAQYGGSLGGVVNVIMKHGSNDWHGSLGTSYESGNMDGSPNNYTRYDPQGSRVGLFDPTAQAYQPQKDHLRDVEPSATVGGAIWKDHVWGFLGFAPEYISRGRTVNFGTYDANAGLQTFNRDQQTYYSNARIDAKVTNKATVFASWLYQHQREAGQLLPRADSTTGLFNPDATTPLDVYEHGYGYAAPDTTLNIGADITITPRLVSTTRFGYFFENYHDFGFPTVGTIYIWQTSGSNARECDPTTAVCAGTPFSQIPAAAGLIQAAGFQTAGWDPNFTLKNADKHVQFDQDIALFKSGWWGTHNLKGGYQLNRLSNDIFQRYSAPTVELYPGASDYSYTQGTNVAGTYGDAVVVDFGTKGQAISYNHAFFAQDAWTIGKGVTINAGIRFEHENVPAESFGLQAGLPANPIEFGWGSKIGPRIGFAWDIFRDGKAKVFGSYGVFNDEMKLNLAISSFGGQWWNNCLYTMNDPNYKDIVVAPNAARFYCQGNDPTVPASLTPTGDSGLNNFIENINYRGTEGTIGGLKPYRQHESVFGADYQLKKNLAFEVRWDRRRLDNVIEDTAFFQNGSEIFFVANPGEGLNSYNTDCGSACPHNVKGARAYDGLEFRLNKAVSNNWYGMVSYTYSYFRGNYAGLTSTDLSDGGGGRNSPNNSRAFDETYFEFNAYGQPANGRLATDRPNTFKGYTYYQLPWAHKRATSTIGWIQYIYQGTPLSSYVDVGGWQQPNFAPVYPEGRGHWADISQDPVTGTLTVNSVGLRRTPWYFQSDASFIQEFKPNRNNEKQVVGFQATISNLLNSRSAVAYGSQIDSANSTNPISPSGLYLGQPGFYAAAEHPYPWKTLLNTDGVVLNSTYGKPIAYELSRTIRVQVSFTF
jgi:hypothetical protein